MPAVHYVRRAFIYFAVLAAAAGCTNPREIAYLNEQMNQAADAIADVRTTMSNMQSSIDSLTLVVAKQDSTIGRIAIATNVQIIK